MLLYETQSQPLISLLFILAGFACAFLFDVGNFILLFVKMKNIARFLIDFVVVLFASTTFFFALLFLHYGEIRFFLILSFVIGITIQRMIFMNFLAKFSRKVYLLVENKRKRAENGDKHDSPEGEANH